MRKNLASVQEVLEICPIENADRIEVATVMGWRCIVQRGEFHAGDKVIYCEVDALLPSERPAFEFMRPRGFRVKTIKLRGHISQGLVFSMNLLEDPELSVGTDVTEQLGITQYIPRSMSVCSAIIGALPGYVPKTDEPRIQSNLGLLKEMRGIPCYVTTKIDGKSGTFVHRDGDFFVCSRSNAFQQDERDVYWMAANRYNVPTWLPRLGNFAVQGEVAGPGVQKNHLRLDRIDFFCFNVFDINAGQYLNFDEFLDFCQQHGLKTVPIDNPGVEFRYDLDELLGLAEGPYESGRHREGIVIRPTVERHSEVLRDRMSFKVLNNQFLLKEE